MFLVRVCVCGCLCTLFCTIMLCEWQSCADDDWQAPLQESVWPFGILVWLCKSWQAERCEPAFLTIPYPCSVPLSCSQVSISRRKLINELKRYCGRRQPSWQWSSSAQPCPSFSFVQSTKKLFCNIRGFFKMTDKQVRTMGLKATNMNEQTRAKAFNSGDEINSEVHDQCHAFHLAWDHAVSFLLTGPGIHV